MGLGTKNRLPVVVQGKIVAQGRLLLQDTFMVSDQDGGLLSRMKERRVFLFEQLVLFSEPLDKKRGFSLPGFLYKSSIKVARQRPSVGSSCSLLRAEVPCYIAMLICLDGFHLFKCRFFSQYLLVNR